MKIGRCLIRHDLEIVCDPTPICMKVKDEKVSRILEQCRRRIIKLTGKQISIAIFGYKEDDHLTFDQIAKAVCCILNVPYSRVVRKCRKQELVFARYLIFFYARQHTNLSHQKIANKLGYRDHTAGVNAVKKVRGFVRSKDDKFLHSMKSINQILNIVS